MNTFFKAAIGGAIALQLAVTPAHALTKEEGTEFITSLADLAISRLTADGLTEAQQKSRLENLLLQNFDMPKIAKFVLGRYWRVATPAQQQEFTKLFQSNIIEAYGSRLNEYSGQQVEIIGSRMSSNNDFILVDSRVKDNAGRSIAVEWRVRNVEPAKIADVAIEGVSMAATQRAEYAAAIQRRGGSIEAFLKTLRKSEAKKLVVTP